MKQSTKDVFRKHGWRIDRAVHNYIYFVFYYPYVKIILLMTRYGIRYLTWFKPLRYVGRFIFDRYHGKLISYDDTKKILTLDEDIRAISDKNKRIIPYAYAYQIIIRNPKDIAVMDCPCKKSTHAPAESINCCLYVGKGHEFWLEHGKKYHSRRISQKEALNIIKAFRNKGYITQAFFKVATGGSTAGVICNCHPDSCVSLIATSIIRKLDTGLSQNAASGYSVAHNGGKCKKCRACGETCHFNAIEFTAGTRAYDRDACLGCGLCVERCPHGALVLYRDPQKAIPLDIDIVKEGFV